MKKLLIMIILLIPALAYSQASNYLILEDIGSFRKITKGGASGDVLAGAGHFGEDHQDESYGVSYHSKEAHLWVDVQVTRHSGSDSDRWLLHELEMSYQKSITLGAAYAAPNPLRDISGNKILFMWGYYAWISNNVVVSIQFTDLTGTKPEPLEVVQAYLQKFPSSIPTELVLDDNHKKQWIKEEMERQLWLCDKWFYQLQLRKVDQDKVFKEVVDHLNDFLDYRTKYYRLKADDEKKLLAGYLSQNNGTGIKSKLDEYKKWWAIHKADTISVP